MWSYLGAGGIRVCARAVIKYVSRDKITYGIPAQNESTGEDCSESLVKNWPELKIEYCNTATIT